MKLIPGFALLLVLFGCGIMNLVFGLPERYIEREVKSEEMVGTWTITPKSETDVDEFLRKFPEWNIGAPYKSFFLNDDGSCKIQINKDWLGDWLTDFATKQPSSCTWDLTEEKNLSDKISPVLNIHYGARFQLYIYEEDNKLILWDFLGDPDDFHPQDFVKSK